MIRALRLVNFKAFSEQVIEFKRLTLLSGFNNTGKSSVIQALLFLRHCSMLAGPYSRDRLFAAGVVHPVLFAGAGEHDEISFELSWEEEEGESKAEWRFWHKEDSLRLLSSSISAVTPKLYAANLFGVNFHHLCANRQRHRPVFIKSHLHQDVPVLAERIKYYMDNICPGAGFEVQAETSNELVFFSPISTDIGSGANYLFPIVAALAATPTANSLVLIENPEISLHPLGQVQLGRLIGLAAADKIQIVVKTHSKHILDGICAAVHDVTLHEKDLQLYHFYRQDKQIKVVSPRMDTDGKLDFWPEGFIAAQ